jgi:8-oxo-dGTP pyrophosphatase MutT (NUDIX family)
MSGEPKKAATVLILRAAEGIEVLLVRRSHRASFMANAFVFPGGRVDELDAATAGPEQASRVAASRELREEVALECADLTRLVPFAHWITPSMEPKRFDTDFFVLGLRGDEAGAIRVDGSEVFDPLWLAPGEALGRYLEGRLNLPPPTACTLEELDAEIEEAQDACQKRGEGSGAERVLAELLARIPRRRVLPLLPKLEMGEAPDGTPEIRIVLPWDPGFGELPGEGTARPAMAEGGARVARRIRRCSLRLPGDGSTYAVRSGEEASTIRWNIERADE